MSTPMLRIANTEWDEFPKVRQKAAYSTKGGRAYQMDSLELMKQIPDDSVALVVTSPPFALVRKKAYGNVTSPEYSDWFWPFAEEIFRILRPDGSFVIELGGAWNPGKPVSYHLSQSLSKLWTRDQILCNLTGRNYLVSFPNRQSLLFFNRLCLRTSENIEQIKLHEEVCCLFSQARD